MTLQERCKKFMDELGIPVTSFCRRIDLSLSGYYGWKTGEIKLSQATLERIDSYLKHYGF